MPSGLGLFLDSAETTMFVGLMKDEKVLASNSFYYPRKQAELLLVEIKNTLDKFSYSPKDLNYIAVGIGPGSFTGVRIALAIAKTLAFSLDLKMYVISSLLAYAKYDEPSIICFDARGNRTYFACYKKGDYIIKETILNNDDVKKFILEHADFTLRGNFKHLGIDVNSEIDIFSFYRSLNENNLVKDVKAIKPIYLKDL